MSWAIVRTSHSVEMANCGLLRDEDQCVRLLQSLDLKYTEHCPGTVILSLAGPAVIQRCLCLFCKSLQACDRSTYTPDTRIIVLATVKPMLLDCPWRSSDSPSFTYDVVVQKASTSPPLSRSRLSPHQSSRCRTALNSVQAKRQTRHVLVIRFSKTLQGAHPGVARGPLTLTHVINKMVHAVAMG